MHIVKGQAIDNFDNGDIVIATDHSHLIVKGEEYRIVEQEGIKYVRKDGVYTYTVRPIFKLKGE
jgi:hypothetical protein